MEPPESETPDIFEDLQTRAASAGVLFFLAVICVGTGGVVFTSFILLAALLLMKEWEALTVKQMLVFRLGGYPYIILPCACLIWLRSYNPPAETNFGITIVVALIAVVSATDIGAYFVGRKFGRHRLAPVLSPKKTWEGFGGGCAAAIVTAILASPYVNVTHSPFTAVWVGLFMALLAQAGDLFKSWIKRLAEVKDSGTLLPGHGGLLDRVDGYMFSAPALAFLVWCAVR